jgi:uncharacterized protein
MMQIDSRSFHVFEFQDQKILFDRNTATVSILNDVSYYVLLLLQAGASLPEALERSKVAYPGLDATEVELTLKALQGRGFFKFTSVDKNQQDRMLVDLLDHKPRRIQMLMAQGCNLGCRYCYAWRNGSNQKKTLMPWEIAKASVDYLIKRSVSRTDLQVTFFGGEPLLNYPVIQKVVSYCRDLELRTDKKFTFELITNGTLLSKEVVDFAVEHKFLLFISIDGWKEMHNYNRPSVNGDDVYDTILANAKYANEQYIKHQLPAIKVRANLTNRYHDAFAVGAYLRSLGFNTIGVGSIEPLNHGDNSPSALTEDQADEMHKEATRVMVDSVKKLAAHEKIEFFKADQLRRSLTQFEPRALKGITCGIARNTQIVDNKGNIYPCHRYEGMEAYVIGNILSGGHDNAKTLEYYRKVNQNATARCHSCWIRDYCAGGCAWLLSKKDGHLSDPSERECDRRRQSMERTLWLRNYLAQNAPERFPSDSNEYLANWSWGTAEKYNQANQSVASCGNEGNCGSECGEACGIVEPSLSLAQPHNFRKA